GGDVDHAQSLAEELGLRAFAASGWSDEDDAHRSVRERRSGEAARRGRVRLPRLTSLQFSYCEETRRLPQGFGPQGKQKNPRLCRGPWHGESQSSVRPG